MPGGSHDILSLLVSSLKCGIVLRSWYLRLFVIVSFYTEYIKTQNRPFSYSTKEPGSIDIFRFGFDFKFFRHGGHVASVKGLT